MAELATVIIGRNEGERLLRCLASVQATGSRIVYVDSGSTDGSVEAATAVGADVVALDMSTPFTAARARNAGLERLADSAPDYVQFLDGDCELHSDWIDTAQAYLDTHPDVVAVAGRLRERFPKATRYNRLADAEWDTPLGEMRACGGIAMMRYGPVQEVGGFNPALVAGEEPEMCVRLRAKGWKIWRLDAEMALHDIAMTRFGQWWTRSRRAGVSYASGMALHGAPPERMNVDRVRRALIWGAALPVFAVLLLVLFGAWALPVLLIWPLQVWRLARQGMGWERAGFLTLAKTAEAQGILGFWRKRLTGGAARIIEYK